MQRRELVDRPGLGRPQGTKREAHPALYVPPYDAAHAGWGVERWEVQVQGEHGPVRHGGSAFDKHPAKGQVPRSRLDALPRKIQHHPELYGKPRVCPLLSAQHRPPTVDSAAVPVLRKAESVPRGDVPTVLVVPIVAWLCALFLPLVAQHGSFPTELPPLRYTPAAVERSHHGVSSAPPLIPAAPEIMAAWSILASAQSSNDLRHVPEAQERFGAVLTEAAEGDLRAAHALRTAALREFLRDLRVPGAPMTVLATRHSLVGPRVPPYVNPAVRIAWFDARWERLALRTPIRGALEPTISTLARIPYAERRALVAWELSARCTELLGTTTLRPGDPARCARLRRESVMAARDLDRSYPADEALAAVDVLEALGDENLADTLESLSSDGDAPAVRSELLAQAQDALVRAQSAYAAMLRTRRSYRIEAYLRGVVAELQHPAE